MLWIGAGAGAGKTLGIAGYLASHQRASIWYEVDVEDRDPGTLVANLATLLSGRPRGRKDVAVRLPPVPPEGLRRAAELLFTQLLTARPPSRKPLFLVLDNYQEADGSGPWNELIVGLVLAWASSAPRASRILITSRHRPPAPLARLVADGEVAIIDGDVLRFDEKELGELLRVRRRPKQAPRMGRHAPRSARTKARSLCVVSQGWAVAAVLLSGAVEGSLTSPSATLAGQDVDLLFDYLTAEVARHLSVSCRRALASLAYVHRISARTLKALAPSVRFDRLVADLERAALPFSRDGEGGIRLHDLVRSYLRHRLVPELEPKERARLQTASARVLADEGHLQEAAALCQEAEAWADLTALICAHAPALVDQGRAATLEAALQRLPDSWIDEDPWLGLWRAVCELPRDPALAERRLGVVSAQFRVRGDGVGLKLGAAVAIHAVVIRGEDFRAVRPLLAILDEPAEHQLPPAIEARVRASRLMAFSFIEPGSPASQRAADEALAVPLVTTQVADAIALYGSAIMVYGTAGRRHDAESVYRKAAALARTATHDPLAQLTFLYGETWLKIVAVDVPSVMRTVEEGLGLAEVGDMAVWRANFAGFGYLASLLLGDLASARRYLATFEAALIALPSNYFAGHLFYLKGIDDMRAGAVEQSVAAFRTSVDSCRAAGFLFGEILCCHEEMLVLALHGRFGEIARRREALAGIFASYRPFIMDVINDLVEALVELLASGPAAARAKLETALARAQAAGVYYLPLATTQAVSILASAAFELGIEPAWVAEFVGRHSLTPPADDTGPVWPWPLVVRTLGPFSIVAAERDTRGRLIGGALRMFKALVALGGGPVRTERLVADLWPAAPAAGGRAAFDTTLHRLRRCLGDDSLVQLEAGEVRLDRRRIWCDAWALDFLNRQVESVASAGSAQDLDRFDCRLRALYRGPFCADEQEAFVVRARGRLARSFAQTAAALSDGWLRVGDAKRAVSALEDALETDELNEPLYAKLIRLHAEQGASAEAARLLERCAHTLRTRLGVDPSPETAHAGTKISGAGVGYGATGSSRRSG